MRPEDLYHIGIVVDDLDAALRWYTDVAGYEWCEEYAGDQVVETPGGEVTIQLRFAYSVNEPRLEVLQAVPGTLWTPSDSGIHHLGYWSDDVDGDVETLVATGLEVEAKAPLPDGSALWAYCKAAAGTRVEVVSSLIKPIMTHWFETGRMPRGDEIDLPVEVPQP
jgi:catechol 2,3-dioxygenase-like lactoylglutathione lyase family enzyme